MLFFNNKQILIIGICNKEDGQVEGLEVVKILSSFSPGAWGESGLTALTQTTNCQSFHWLFCMIFSFCLKRSYTKRTQYISY